MPENAVNTVDTGTEGPSVDATSDTTISPRGIAPKSFTADDSARHYQLNKWNVIIGACGAILGTSITGLYHASQIKLEETKAASATALENAKFKHTSALESQKWQADQQRAFVERRNALLKSYLGESGEATWGYRLLVARFIEETEDEPKLHEWARKERVIAEKEIRNLEDKLAPAPGKPEISPAEKRRLQDQVQPKFTTRGSCETCRTSCQDRVIPSCKGAPDCETLARKSCTEECSASCG